jgi:predicted O-methyltransferase YrrM
VIEIVDVSTLVAACGGDYRIDLPVTPQAKALADWKMEIDDAPILESLWRSQSPSRHLEFGTWEGFGATLVARITDAEIWTINLPEGETGSDGAPLYSSTDAGNFIGHLYREAGFSHRVHQVLCDSRDVDISSFSTEPFDTILIDGGHTPDVVAIDTKNALRVLKPGGMCVWHDFCPDPEALSKNLAPLGVVQAVVENFEEWKASFDRFFWVRKSWILVGLGKKPAKGPIA